MLASLPPSNFPLITNLRSLLLNPYFWFRRGWILRSDWIRMNFNLLQWGLEHEPCLPSLKLTQPLNIDPLKRRFLLETTIFLGLCWFQGGHTQWSIDNTWWLFIWCTWNNHFQFLLDISFPTISIKGRFQSVQSLIPFMIRWSLWSDYQFQPASSPRFGRFPYVSREVAA